MQGLADGYFVLPYTIGDYLSQILNGSYLRIDLNLQKQKGVKIRLKDS
jgi:hypothetical protein